jgi:hypothetical protein
MAMMVRRRWEERKNQSGAEWETGNVTSDGQCTKWETGAVVSVATRRRAACREEEHSTNGEGGPTGVGSPTRCVGGCCSVLGVGGWAPGGPTAPSGGSARRRPLESTWAPGFPLAGAVAQGLGGRGDAADVRAEGPVRALASGGVGISLGGGSLVFVLVHKEG